MGTITLSVFSVLIVLILILGISFVSGILWSRFRYSQYVKEMGCPFKHACLHYDSIETKNAIRRVLTLMIDHKVPVSDIKDIIKETIK